MKIAIRVSVGLATLCSAFSPAAFAADNDPVAQDETVMIRTEDLSTIDVIGERPLSRQEIKDGVRDIFQRRMPFDPIPRFHDNLCLHVGGLGETIGNEVADRIRANAEAAGLGVAKPGCTANALVLVVDRPARLVERLRDEMPQMFNVSTSRQINAQVGTNRPVITWSALGLRNSAGGGLLPGVALPGGQAFSPLAGFEFPTTDAYTPSRITNPFSRSKQLSVVIFDVRKLNDVHLVQLADYATVHLLATPRADIAEIAGEVPTILSLFALGPRKAPVGLTALDRAYLKGLYAMEPNDWSSRLGGFALAAYQDREAARE